MSRKKLEAFTLTNLGRIQGRGLLDIDSIDNFGTFAPDPVSPLTLGVTPKKSHHLQREVIGING